MSLLGYQRAMSALSASPDLVREVRRVGEEALAGFDLTDRERRRVASAAAQKGIVINCTLHRSNRISSAVAMLPNTIHLLGGEIRDVADRFWEVYPNPDFNTRRELLRFGRWLRGELEAERMENPFLREVLDYELDQYVLGMLPRRRIAAEVAAEAGRFPDGPVALHPLVRVAAFRHDPAVLFTHLQRKDPLPYDDVPEGEFYLLLDARAEQSRTVPIDLPWGRLLKGIADGTGEPTPEQTADLLKSGHLVHTAPKAGAAEGEGSEALAAAGAA